MRFMCFIGIHRWFYYSDETRSCKVCGRQEESDPYFQGGVWYEVEYQRRLLKVLLRKLGIKC